MNKEELRRYWKFEIPSTNLFVVEENYDNQPILKFGEYLSDMQCGDTDTKLYITDLKYVKQLQQENKQLKDNWNKFKKWLENEVKRYAEDYENIVFSNVEYLTSAHILNKMQELEKGKEW